MNTHFSIPLAGIAVIFLGCAVPQIRPDLPAPYGLGYPQARRETVKDLIFGVEVRDPYRWLENAQNSEVSQWIDKEADFTRNYLDKLPHREALAKRMTELTYRDSFSAPRRKADKLFYSRRSKTQEKGEIYSSDLDGKNEHVIFDLEHELPGTSSMSKYSISNDAGKMAYVVNENNTDEGVAHVRDLKTGKDSETDVVAGLKYDGVCWNADGTGFYYQYFGKDKDLPPTERIGHATTRYHRLGSKPGTDEVVLEATKDSNVFPYVESSWDLKWLFVVHSRLRQHTTVFAKDLTRSGAGFSKIFDEDAEVSSIEAFEGSFYLKTNLNAPRFKVIAITDEKTQARDAIPEDSSKVLQEFEIVGGKFVLRYMENVASTLEIRNLGGKPERQIKLSAKGTVNGVIGRPDDRHFYFRFETFLQDWQILKADVESGKSHLWVKRESPFDPKPFTTEQLWFKSKDGTRVPMWVVRRRDMKKDGGTRFILYGYGGYGSSFLPSFSPSIATWLEQGGGYALANIRGGGEFGEEWHRAGMKARKQNVYDDFIAAAEFLIREKYTAPSHLAISGGSNGGLLVGAVMTQRPELMKAVICEVPTLDMLRYHLVGDGKFWTTELGSPDNPEDFAVLHAYSPYHRVRDEVSYPATMIVSSRNDDRVDPMHARKFAAALQAVTGTKNPILLRIEQSAGHGGAAGVKPWVNTHVDTLSFLLSELGN